MDLGLFRRSGKWIGVWLVGAVALTALLYYVAHIRMLYNERSLARRAAMMRLIPSLRSVVAEVESEVDSFAQGAGSREDSIAGLSVRLNRVADATGFQLDSFDIVSKAAGGTVPVKIRIRGRGNFRAIVAFAEDVRRPESLLTIESAHVALTGLKSDPDYSGEFVLAYHYIGI